MPARVRTTLPERQSPARPRSLRPLLTIGLAAASWGTAGAAAAVLNRIAGLGPVVVSCWRFALGALLLMAARPFLRRTSPRRASPRRAFPRRPGQDRPTRTHPAVLLGTGVLMAGFQTCYLAAVDFAGLALGTTATLGIAPVLTALGARVLLGERLTRRGAVVIALALTGLVLLALGSSTGGPTGTRPLLGLLCALGSAAGSAGTNLLGQAQSRGGRTGDPYDRALVGFAVGGACLLLLTLLAGPALVGPLLPGPHRLPEAVALLLYLGAVPTALAYALFFAALRVVRATTVSVVMMLEPVAALLLGTTLLGERLTPTAACGTAVLLLAVVFLE